MNTYDQAPTKASPTPPPAARSSNSSNPLAKNRKSKIPRLRPEIEAEIKFAEWTAGGVLRHAEFVTPREA
jgi:ATP-dependent DNA ligase